MQAAGGIDDQHVAAGVDGLAAGFFGQAFDSWAGVVAFADFAFVNVGLDRLGDNFELLARSGAIDVHRNQQRAMPTLLQPVRQFAGRRGLAGTLQARHQDYGRRLRGEFELGGVPAQSLDQFVAQNLDDLFARRKGSQQLLADGLGPNVVDELLYDLEIDVRFEQSQANLSERLADVFFGDACLDREGS